MAKKDQRPAQLPAEREALDKAMTRFGHRAGGAGTDVESARAAREIETSMLVAKRFPRDVIQARERILQMCSRLSLAEGATYSYQRGSTQVIGPSIRMAEAIAQAWGNLLFGISELSQEDGVSSVQAFAVDLETNTRQTKNFIVPHIRFSNRGGIEHLTDPRDIYETVANQGARRLRSCILGLIPGDVIDAALDQCEHTLKHQGGAPADQLKEVLAKLAAIGVTPKMVETKLGHKVMATNLTEVLRLKRVVTAIADGLTTVSAEFPARDGDASKPETKAKYKTLDEYKALVAAAAPGSPLQAVLDEAEAVLKTDAHRELKAHAEKVHGGGDQ